jgi:hypothetical protein
MPTTFMNCSCSLLVVQRRRCKIPHRARESHGQRTFQHNRSRCRHFVEFLTARASFVRSDAERPDGQWHTWLASQASSCAFETSCYMSKCKHGRLHAVRLAQSFCTTCEPHRQQPMPVCESFGKPSPHSGTIAVHCEVAFLPRYTQRLQPHRSSLHLKTSKFE